MKKILFVIILIASFNSCKSSKHTRRKRAASSKIITKKNKKEATAYKSKTSKKATITKSKANTIVDYAVQFKGIRYKWGGTTKAGMDCSGLVYQSFKSHDIILPRTSRDMAKRGNKISLKNAKVGDLLFFKTQNRRNSINHVGLVVKSKSGSVQFIHATSSKGVIVSNLSERYWNSAFSEARRIL
ncbi:hypothetical protein A8C32_18255 [Flavivirga aquatica]|uniref:NlpC/P60 domain-containing protein n=1 Tax=Flavivirga aquatica TaxID=1849968 RepID=A0A1E5T7P5_9FLAO|nr:C40 family peptidase [Flavivirga aquatica]OEK07380.1 hypothetical protein A8C32_18255 [Flavivirga aquatica]